MKKYFLISIFNFLFMMHSIAQENQSGMSEEENTAYAKFGVFYKPTNTKFRLFSPNAQAVKLKIYNEGVGGVAKEYNFRKLIDYLGTWDVTVNENIKNKFYTYQIKVNDIWKEEMPDIYATAVGVNGKRGQIIDLKETNPIGWELDKSPVLKKKNDAIVYELHVRDATIFSNAKNKGKFLGLTEKGLKNSKGNPVGLDHIKNLGVTHVQILPMYDYYTVDETIPNNKTYNWGYDPLNYNTPEGSYSTNAYDGKVRIKECKQMIQTFHKNGLRVVMDVVYNHTMFAKESGFEQLNPGYYYRFNNDGSYSNASGCSNETSSEKPMTRKFIIESLLHWVNEYHVDGFRFDLMAIHDIETMNAISKALHEIRPDIIIYGEGWTSGDSPLPEEKRALKKYAFKMDKVGVFSDDIRDAQKGSVFDHKDNGFISGKKGVEESIKFGIVGGVKHSQIDYAKVNYSKEPYCLQPYQHISYNECHDNHTLWDRLLNSNPNASESERKKMYELGLAIVITSQGIPFLHAGQEFCRTKLGEENSYNKPDSINAMHWERLNNFNDIHNWTTQLIKFRKESNLFNLGSTALVEKCLKFISISDQFIVYEISNAPNSKYKKAMVIINASNQNSKFVNPALFVPPFTRPLKWKLAISNISYSNLQKQKDGMSFSVWAIEK